MDPQAADGSAPAPPSTSSLFAELGLAPEDVDALAQIPENEISIETLPYLIMQLKAKKVTTHAHLIVTLKQIVCSQLDHSCVVKCC